MNTLIFPKNLENDEQLKQTAGRKDHSKTSRVINENK